MENQLLIKILTDEIIKDFIKECFVEFKKDSYFLTNEIKTKEAFANAYEELIKSRNVFLEKFNSDIDIDEYDTFWQEYESLFDNFCKKYGITEVRMLKKDFLNWNQSAELKHKENYLNANFMSLTTWRNPFYGSKLMVEEEFERLILTKKI